MRSLHAFCCYPAALSNEVDLDMLLTNRYFTFARELLFLYALIRTHAARTEQFSEGCRQNESTMVENRIRVSCLKLKLQPTITLSVALSNLRSN